MEKETFKERLVHATIEAHQFASKFIEECLPTSFRYRILSNPTIADTPLLSGELASRDDSARERAESQQNLYLDDIVGILWRNGKVPIWINIAAFDETGSETLIELTCSDDFTSDEALLYQTQFPPFEIHSPTYPASVAIESNNPLNQTSDGPINRRKFSIHHRAECWSEDDIERISRHAEKVLSLTLRGFEINDETLEATPDFPNLDRLELLDLPINGNGFSCLSKQPKIRCLYIRFGSTECTFDKLPTLPSLEDLHIENPPMYVGGLDKIDNRLPSLTNLRISTINSPYLKVQCLRGRKSGTPVEDEECLSKEQAAELIAAISFLPMPYIKINAIAITIEKLMRFMTSKTGIGIGPIVSDLEQIERFMRHNGIVIENGKLNNLSLWTVYIGSLVGHMDNARTGYTN